MEKTNWLAVIVSAVAGMLTGFLWYGLLFQQQWMDGNGLTMNEDQTKFYKYGEEVQASNTPMIVNFVIMLVYSLLMNWLLKRSNATTLSSGATLGGVVGLIMGLGVLIANMFAMAPMSLSWVDGSYSLALFTVMGAILGAWQKK
jgi:hypothetical protein